MVGLFLKKKGKINIRSLTPWGNEGSDFPRKETEIIGNWIPPSMVGHAKSTQCREKDDEANFGIELNFLNYHNNFFFSFLFREWKFLWKEQNYLNNFHELCRFIKFLLEHFSRVFLKWLKRESHVEALFWRKARIGYWSYHK